MVISGGIVTPPDHRPKSQQGTPLTSAKVYEDVDILREKEDSVVLISQGSRPGDKLEQATGTPVSDIDHLAVRKVMHEPIKPDSEPDGKD